jgi:hypothetical protein
MTAPTAPSPPDQRAHAAARTPATGRRAGYVATVVVNAVLLWIAHQLLAWGWPRFLTEEFDEVLPIVSASFVATIVANLVFVVADPRWLTSLLEALTSAISLAAGIVVLRVFPFDFSSYAHDWSWLLRIVIVVGIVATAITLVVRLAHLLDEATGTPSSR